MSTITFPLLNIARHRMGTDGAGITTLVASAGCPLRCEFCINKKLLKEASPKDITPEELFSMVRQDELYFLATGGGITFGGGEPLLYADFIREFRAICPPAWKITAETSLFVPRNYLAAVTDAVDLFVVDCKDMNGDTYRKYTGGELPVMKENLEFLLQRIGAERIIVRVPLIPGYNTAGDQKKSAEALLQMGIRNTDLFEYVVRE